MASKRSLPSIKKLVGRSIPLTSKDLNKIPLRERILLIGLWHALNEQHALRKMILLATDLPVLGQTEEAARSLNCLVLTKAYVMKLFETWRFYRKAREFPEFPSRYLANQEFHIEELARELGDYFGEKNNLIATIRDKLAGHYDYDQMMLICSSLKDIDSFVFMPESQGNTLYWIAEEVMAHSLATLSTSAESRTDTKVFDANSRQDAMPKESKQPLLRAAVDRMVTDAIRIDDLMGNLVQGIGVIAINTHLGSYLVTDAPEESVRMFDSRSVRLPYFLDFAKSYTS